MDRLAWIVMVLCCACGGKCDEIEFKERDGDIQSKVSGAGEWTHRGLHGVDHWPSMFPKCGGSAQSPINIATGVNNDQFVYDAKLTNDLDIVKAQAVDEYYMINNGHTVYVDTQEAEVSIFGANLGRTYSVVGPHFHWGSKNSRGSEHTFNGVEYPLEMHIVTYDAETYATVGDAVASNEPGALAVVSVMFKLTEQDNPFLNPLVDKMPSVLDSDKENKVAIPYFELRSLLPAETSEYFRYTGSLTTPTCNEVVTWTVLLHHQTVSQRQLDAFRNVLGNVVTHDGSSKMPLVNNFRPVQPLNGRTVYKSFLEPSIDLPTNDVNNDRQVGEEGDAHGVAVALTHRLVATVATFITAVLLL